MVRNIKLLCLVMMFCVPQVVIAAATATLDRSITSFGESVQLTIQVDGSADEDPDLSSLAKDFDILSQSHSSNMSFINGDFSRSTQWLIGLMPMREGVLLIPSISLGNMQTQPLRLQVLAQSAKASPKSKDIFLEVETSTSEVYVQSQVIYTVKLYRAVNLVKAQLTEPDMPQVIVKKLGDDRNYETVFDQRRFVVTERKYALFPQQSGLMQIPALQFDGQISNSRSMFAQGRAVRQTSEVLEVNVLPIPQDWQQSEPWLPAENISIREIWTDGQTTDYKVGEPLTRTVEITAKGLVAEQLPQLFSEKAAEGFKQYPDQPVLNTSVSEQGVVGTRQEKVALIPVKSGELMLPSVKVDWWNTQTQSRQSVLIPARTVSVVPADSMPATMTPPSLPNVVQDESSVVEEKQAPQKTVKQLMAPAQDQNLWPWLTLGFALSWLLTVFLWWWKSSKQVNTFEDQSAKNEGVSSSIKVIKKEIERACSEEDLKALVGLLPKWGAAIYADESIQHLAKLKGKSEALDQQIEALERLLYSKDGNLDDWSANDLLDALNELEQKKISEPTSSSFKGLYN